MANFINTQHFPTRCFDIVGTLNPVINYKFILSIIFFFFLLIINSNFLINEKDVAILIFAVVFYCILSVLSLYLCENAINERIICQGIRKGLSPLPVSNTGNEGSYRSSAASKFTASSNDGELVQSPLVTSLLVNNNNSNSSGDVYTTSFASSIHSGPYIPPGLLSPQASPFTSSNAGQQSSAFSGGGVDGGKHMMATTSHVSSLANANGNIGVGGFGCFFSTLFVRALWGLGLVSLHEDCDDGSRGYEVGY